MLLLNLVFNCSLSECGLVTLGPLMVLPLYRNLYRRTKAITGTIPIMCSGECKQVYIHMFASQVLLVLVVFTLVCYAKYGGTVYVKV